MMIDPEHTVSSIKRHMGDRTYRVDMFNQELNPIKISSYILDHLKLKASEQSAVDLKGTVYCAVVCRPANFTADQIDDTRKAAEMAGFDKVWLLEEPVAAAIAYGFDKGEEQNLLIYDLGGGTFDVCILHAGKDDKGGNTYKVLATEGIQKLGGDDFDQQIMNVLCEQLKEKSGIDILDEEKDQGISLKKIRNAKQIVREAAEQAKKDLSEQEATEINVPDVITDESGGTHSIEHELTREAFDGMIRDLIAQSKSCIETALNSASMKIEDIDKILMVGGSTKVPLVRTMINEMFGRDPWGDVEPMLCVSQGAAIKGAALLADLVEPGEVDDGDVHTGEEVEPITNYNLGIEVRGSRFSTVIEKGVDVPVSQTKLYAVGPDNPPTIRISVFQAPDGVELVTDDSAKNLGEFYLGGFPEAEEGKTNKIEVTFDINEENALTVSAVCTTAEGVKGDITITKD
jgi:molecular chaperone DnaK (HSP70)